MSEHIDPASIPATREELLDFLDEHCGWVGRCLADPHTSWMPSLGVFIREPGDPKPHVWLYALSVPFNEHHEKREALRRIGRALYAERKLPAAAVLSAEAWVSSDPGPGKQPADHPDRREAISVAGSTIGGKHMALRTMIVTRGEGNRIVPGQWEPPLTEGVTTLLLNQLWAGFFEEVIGKRGLPTPPT